MIKVIKCLSNLKTSTVTKFTYKRVHLYLKFKSIRIRLRRKSLTRGGVDDETSTILF